MKITHLLVAASAAALALPASAQDVSEPAPNPNAIVEAAPSSAWISITPEDLLVMTLAPLARGPGQASRDGSPREVVIQLMPEPFSQGWVENIRTLARAQWYDGISVNRVQDNYVVQWGDPGHDNPESGEAETKPLPEGLNVMGEEDYTEALILSLATKTEYVSWHPTPDVQDVYADGAMFESGWPIAYELDKDGVGKRWPVHCYGMVGVGRNLSPDTGTGAELYTVIGHAPRHLDRNIALVGRVIEGMEHLSSLPRGSGALGFYTEEEAELRTPIRSIRVASDLPKDQQPTFEYLSNESETFARYAKARANRRDPFFIVPAGGADICNIPVPVRAVEHGDK